MHPKLGHMLDDGTIDFALMQVLEQLIKYPTTIFSGNTRYVRNTLLVSPIFQALFDLNIIFKSKYWETWHVHHRLYVDVINEHLQERRKKMSYYEKLQYRWFRRGPIRFGWYIYGVHGIRKSDFNTKASAKNSVLWEVAEVYYDVPKHADTTKGWM